MKICRNINQLHNTCEKGDVEEVLSLISRKDCNINALNVYGESPLHIVCKHDHLEIVKILLKCSQL